MIFPLTEKMASLRFWLFRTWFVSQMILKYNNNNSIWELQYVQYIQLQYSSSSHTVLFAILKGVFPCQQNLCSSFLIMNGLDLRAKCFSHKFGNHKLSPWFRQETALSLISLGKCSRGACGASAFLLARIKTFSHKLSFRKYYHKIKLGDLCGPPGSLITSIIIA